MDTDTCDGEPSQKKIKLEISNAVVVDNQQEQIQPSDSQCDGEPSQKKTKLEISDTVVVDHQQEQSQPSDIHCENEGNGSSVAKLPDTEVVPESKAVPDSEAVPKSEVVPDSEIVDPLAYTKTGEFTSEIFKIVIDNVPRYVSPADLKKYLKNVHGLEPVKIKRPFKKSFAYVTFRNEESRQKAMKSLHNTIWKKNTLEVNTAKPDHNPFARNNAKGDRRIQDFASVREKTAPLYNMEYSDQLNRKMGEIQHVLNGYKKMLKKSWPTGFPEEDYEFKLLEIKPSPAPALHGYRNKCEFTVGKNGETNDVHCVGFVKGSFNQGTISIESPEECKEICSDVMIEEVQRFKSFIVKSEFPTYDIVANVGAWKGLEIRTTQQNDIMITPIVDKRQLTPERLQELKSSLIDFYKNRDNNFSLFLKLVGGKEEIFHLSGPEYMIEHLCGFHFQITSGSFFQVNTAGAEVLYQTIRDTAKLDENTILLDVCCGTGTIGIMLSKYVKWVHGIELVESAIEDAKKNAKRNNIENITFIAGNAKFAVARVAGNIPKSNQTRIVAVVDPPRNGLHCDVISCLRKNEMIAEVIYVSCDIKQISDNIVSLCGPTSRRYLGDPFKFVNCVAVDMFPHTNRFEVIFHFKR